MAAARLLVDFRYGIGPARLVSRCPAGRSLLRLPTGSVWLSSGLRPRRAPWRGVAQEGIARLEVALPVLADNWVLRGDRRARRGRRQGSVWHRQPQLPLDAVLRAAFVGAPGVGGGGRRRRGPP